MLPIEGWVGGAAVAIDEMDAGANNVCGELGALRRAKPRLDGGAEDIRNTELRRGAPNLGGERESRFELRCRTRRGFSCIFEEREQVTWGFRAAEIGEARDHASRTNVLRRKSRICDVAGIR